MRPNIAIAITLNMLLVYITLRLTDRLERLFGDAGIAILRGLRHRLTGHASTVQQQCEVVVYLEERGRAKERIGFFHRTPSLTFPK